MKYIDADLLRKEVKRLEKTAHKSALGCADSETRKFHEGKDFAYQHAGVLIDSLQQEMWKPSEEQLKYLLMLADYFESEGGTSNAKTLRELYENLKKL